MRPLTTLLLLLVPAVAAAQEGTVRYDMTVRLDVELPPEMAHMQDEFPSSRTVPKLLAFDETGSLMTEPPREDDETASRPRRVRMMSWRSEDATHADFETGTLTEKRDFLGRTFLVTGEPPALAWRLTDERVEFLGYLAQKAVTTRDSVGVEAWFTPEIPVPAGPGPYGGLPGLILVLTEDGGRRTFEAKEVSLGPLAEGAVVAPREGRRVTREEYDRIVEEKMEEMGADRRGGAVIIRRN